MTRRRTRTLPYSLTERQYLQLEGELTGLCRSCGHRQGGCEPDATLIRCAACAQPAVTGVEALLERDEIVIIPGGRKAGTP